VCDVDGVFGTVEVFAATALHLSYLYISCL
jgi:hypothetical protein